MNLDELKLIAKALINNEEHEISMLSNISALLYEHIDNINWIGFYLEHQGNLILGPFQGLVACSKIKSGSGVCGSAFKENKRYVVKDVHSFDGHIACDSASNSEVVVPIVYNDKVYAVLDVDSPMKNRFDPSLADFFSDIVNLIEERLLLIK